MRKRKLKKGLAWILACALFMGMTPVNTQAKEQKNSEIVLFNANVASGGSVTGGAATIEPTAEPKEIVTVTPFSGLWKYYGQKRTFIRDVHYAVSDEKDLPDGVTLTISSETAGKQQFVLKDERSSDEKQKISYQLAKNAPAYEIRAYHTNAVAKTEKDTINIADRTGLTDDKVEIEAPAGYRISSQASVDANWADTMSVTLTEGKNEIAYYLASKQADATKNAIDTTNKTITIVADFTAPQITSVSCFDSDTDTTSSGLITGNEPGKFYYVVLPKALGEEAEKESGGMTTKFILSRVTSHYGIVGYGRVDGAKASNFSFNGLAAETEYVIYSFMTDDAGNVVTEGVALFSGDGGTGFFNYMYNGIVNSSAIEIIAFLMVVGGAFGIMIRTGAIESGLIGLIRKAKGAEKLLIPILFVLFSLGGAVFGMGEEALPFTMILCPLFVAVGYDSVIAVLVTYVATQIGFGSSWMNPFSVGIAQGIAGIDVFSGAGFRMVMWVVFTALGCGMTMFYASKIKKTPTISIAYKTDAYFREQNEKTGIDEGHSFGLGHILVLLTLAATVVWVVWGVMTQGYYMPEIATQFFIMGIVSGVIGVIFKLNDMKLNDIATSFKDGAKDLIGAALVVAMAQGIMQVLGGSDPTTPTVINTIMYNISNALSGVSGAVAAVLMYLFQSVFNFFVVSGTGQAAITMPIMAPLSDLLGVSRQTAVVAFQLGDAFTNLIVPTSGCLIGSLAIAKIEWSNWIKFMWKFLGVLMIGAIITILIAVGTGF